MPAGSNCCSHPSKCLDSTQQTGTGHDQDMIKSSNKRIKLLEVGDNVRIPIPSVDRAPLGPTSLVGAVLGVSSTGNTQLGTKHGKIASHFSHSEVSPCGSNQLLAPTDVPDVQLSVRTAARQEVGSARTRCGCRTTCQSGRCNCYKLKVKCGSKCHGSRARSHLQPSAHWSAVPFCSNYDQLPYLSLTHCSLSLSSFSLKPPAAYNPGFFQNHLKQIKH